MDWRVLKIKLMEFLSSSRTQVGLPCSSRTVEFGLVSLLWFSSRSIYLKLTLEFLDFFPISPIYNFLVPFSIFCLGFRLRGLCEELRDTDKVQVNTGTDYCSKCSSKSQSCNGFLRTLKKSGSGVQEKEVDDAMKLREGSVKGRKPQLVKDSGTGFHSHCVCWGACESKIQSCMHFQCEMCRGKRTCSVTTRNRTGRKDVEEDKEDGEEEEEEEEEEGFDDDEGDDAVKLRKELVKERKLRVWTEMELEKERRATSSAADEAMAKISLLQNEKGVTEREARQYREMAVQKQAYDHQVIENLKWIILNLQEEKIGIEKSTSDAPEDQLNCLPCNLG